LTTLINAMMGFFLPQKYVVKNAYNYIYRKGEGRVTIGRERHRLKQEVTIC
jgi:hypothetical protein